MMIRSLLSITVFLFLMPSKGISQDLNSRVLLTVDGRKTEAGEFIRMYNKSIEPGKVLPVGEYLNQFILFKLKVADAMKLGYDTTRAFRTELKGYRDQLSQNYLTDLQSKEKLLRAAYQRSLTDINAWHILVALSPEASPEDTLRAWQKASDIRERIIKGESFEAVARGTSDDKSVLMNGGNLGYFNVFQMIMPFEDAAYSLRKNEISQPVRTPYGYHVIKVTDKRPSPGRLRVAHIMKASPPGTSEADASKAEQEINSVYNRLKSGESFSRLAALYSDHRESAVKGGEMEWFGTGDIISAFTEAAFALKDTGTFTKPVRTPYGWHIIKLLEKKPPRTWEESKSYLESRFNQSYLNSIARKSFINKLKKEYKFSLNTESVTWFIQNTDTLIIQGLKKYDHSLIPTGNLYTFADQKLTNNEFASFIEKRGYMIVTKDSSDFINRTIDARISDHILKYEDSVLEKKNPEFRYLMNEFHDGILLFDISGKKVWNRVNDDSTGLHKYYDEHKMNYLTKPGVEAVIYTLKQADGAKKLESAYLKYSGKPASDDLLKKKFNRKSDTLLTIKRGRWMKGDDSFIDGLKWEKGKQSVTINGYPAIVDITAVIEPQPLGFEEVRAEMMTGYQEFLENDWTEQLKKKYNVRIDNTTLSEIRKKLGHD
jgi:peptidyl-prolyl cis-trans isomerase SurA